MTKKETLYKKAPQGGRNYSPALRLTLNTFWLFPSSLCLLFCQISVSTIDSEIAGITVPKATLFNIFPLLNCSVIMNLCKFVTIRECPASYTRHTVRYHYARKCATNPKRPLPYACHTIWYLNTCKPII